MEKKSNKVTFIEVLKIILKRTKISTLIMLIVTFASASFAWFIYATKVSAGITAHIDMWNIVFTTEDNQISETVNFVIPHLYPGMDDYEDSISAYNMGEKQAQISYEVMSVKILGVNYDVSNQTQIISRLQNDFPFHITFDLTSETLDTSVGSSTFTVYCEWDYESGNDTLDTYWGQQSYTYNSNNPGAPSIELTVKIQAVQTE